jgi:hypothetical protein
VENFRTVRHNNSKTKHIKIVLLGLLLFNLISCEKNKPEITQINLDLPNIDGVQPSKGTLMSDGYIPLEPIKTVASVDAITQQAPQVLDLIIKNKQQFAPNLLDSLFLSDHFYPLGWSKDGKKLAYGIQGDQNGTDTVFAGVFIQDLVSDKVIWKLNKSSLQREGYFKRVWNENYQQIRSTFTKHKIILGSDGLVLNTTSLSYGGDTFSYTVKAKQASDGQIQSYRVLLNSNAKGSKEISKTTFKRVDLKNTAKRSKEKIAVIGYFQGKDKARVATLLGVMEVAEEGKRIMRYKIIGASLKYGKWHE